jgi:catecholate siderophore receptor
MLGATVFAAAVPAAAATHADTQGPASSEQQEGARSFQIPAGPLGDALAAFERVSGLKVTLEDPALATIQSPGASGSLTPSTALERLLAGTSLHASFSGTDVLVKVRGVNEFVAVTGEAPRPASPKYTQPLRDTPVTFVVIPQAVLHDQGATSLRDALRNTPGITLTAGEGGTAPGDNVFIRGFSARNDVYIDGARDPGVVSRDTFNTEAVEVAKGPSSVTAGRGSTGGSVNLVTKAASLENAGEFRGTFGNADQRRTTVDINRRLSDSVAFRFNGMWQDSGVPRRDEVKQKAWGFAPSIALGLGTPTTLKVGYQRLDQDNVPDHGLPGTLPDQAIAAGKTIDDIDFSNFYGLASRDHETMTSDVVTATIEHRVKRGHHLRNLSRYGRNVLDRVVTSPRAATAANATTDPGFNPAIAQIRRTDTKYQYRDDKTFTNQTDYNAEFSTGTLQHSAVAGLEIARDKQPSYAATDLFASARPPVTDLFNPDPEQLFIPTITPTGAASQAKSTSLAMYAFDTVKLNDKLQADLSLRWDRIDVNYITVAATTLVRSEFGRIDRALSGRAGLIYKPVAKGSIYGAYSTSFNPSYDGAFGLTLAGTGVNNSALPPERSRNFEVGSKWDVTSQLFATVAVFRTEKTNAKSTDAVTGATVLAGDQLVKGVEFGFSGSLTDRWGVFAGLSLMDGRIKESLVSAEIDRRLSYVPEQSFNVWTTYRLPPNVTIGGGAQYTGGYFLTNTNTLATANLQAIQRLTRYWLVSAMGSYRVTAHVDLQLNINNLANERYIERANTGHVIPGPGRSIVIGPMIRF